MEKRKSKTSVLVRILPSEVVALKWERQKGKPADILAVSSEALHDAANPQELTEALKKVLSIIGYAQEAVTLLLSLQKASSRYFRFPSTNRKEIENMVMLQASKLLPYPQVEILAGFQEIDTDQEGFTHVNAAVFHEEALQFYLDAAHAANCNIHSAYIDIYGIQSVISATEFIHEEVLCVIAFSPFFELAVLRKGKVALSRFIRLASDEPGWQGKLTKAILETQNLYLRQSHRGPIKRLLLAGSKESVTRCTEVLGEVMVLPVERLPNAPSALIKPSEILSESGHSLHSMLGFILKNPPDTLNMLPKGLIAAKHYLFKQKETVRILAVLALAIVFFAGAFFRHILQKERYLVFIASETQKIQNQATRLSAMKEQLARFNATRKERKKLLDFLYAAHSEIPGTITVTEIIFRAQGRERFRITGEAPANDTVLEYASKLTASGLFPSEDINVTYATSRTRDDGTNVVDFEISFNTKRP